MQHIRSQSSTLSCRLSRPCFAKEWVRGHSRFLKGKLKLRKSNKNGKLTLKGNTKSLNFHLFKKRRRTDGLFSFQLIFLCRSEDFLVIHARDDLSAVQGSTPYTHSNPGTPINMPWLGSTQTGRGASVVSFKILRFAFSLSLQVHA